MCSRRAEQTADTLQQRAAGRGHRGSIEPAERRDRRPERFEVRERVRVRDGIAAEADGKIVAAVLALDPDPARDPPHRRVVEEQRLDDGLEQVHQVIVPADVRKFMRENRLELRR